MKILIVSNNPGYFLTHRIGLASALLSAGCEVVCVSPDSADGTKSMAIRARGFGFREWRLDKGGINPLQEWAAIRRLEAIYRGEQPDLVHHFTQKPVLYGSQAAQRLGGIPVINSLTGLGYAFTEGRRSLRKWAVRAAIKRMHRHAHRSARTRVVFENEDDRDFFCAMGLVPPAVARVIHGSGIDTEQFVPGPAWPTEQTVAVPCRMLYDKGIREVVEAAAILRRQGRKFRVLLAGLPDPDNPESIPEQVLKGWQDAGVVEWLGYVEDINGLFHRCTIACLLSYREGCPRSLLEAASCGLPVVTTDAPGCRQVVRPGLTGDLVPVRDAQAAATALARLLDDPAGAREMGRAGRRFMQAEFTIQQVVEKMLAIYSELVPFPPARQPRSAETQRGDVVRRALDESSINP